MQRLHIILKTLSLGVLIWACGYMLFITKALTAMPERSDETADAIIVLTGGNYRINTGLEMFASGRASELFISGVNPKTTKWEIMKMWQGRTALPPCCISLGREATTTQQNAQEARAWMKEKNYSSVKIVTSSYHMPRALMEFHHALPDIDIVPSPVTQKDYGILERRFWELTFSEYNKNILRWFILAATPAESPLLEDAG